ncbi:unconventional myosin-XVIIIb [Cyanistes caeruleus]|uniref:unconventional myosin-XVIIIb n=1 Tax=Cyanistes caeruleus TaxID=156563 RepID=UPI000CDA391E|nr:unconventional myosin-XVIIIb [Cyanistes caeruleus]
MKKDVGHGKKEPREIKKPEKTTEESEGPKGELGGTQEKSTDVKKEVGKEKEDLGKGKEMLKESKGTGKSTDKDQAKETSGRSKEMSKSMEKDQDKEASGESTDKDQAARDVWYEAEKVWLIQQDGFTLATQLKPDVGTPELPAGRLRVRRDEDGTVSEVDEDSVQRTNPPSLDQAEDLAALISLNECSVMNTLRQRFRARLPCTYAGPSLVAIGTGPAPPGPAGKVPRGKRDNLPPHICSLAHRAYRNLLMQRQDLEKIQAMFTVLGAFGSVTTSHSSSSTRFSMVLSLDFSATGQVTAAHLQTLLLERARVAQQPEGESSFNIFPLLLAGLDVAERTMLHLHQVAESNSFGIKPFTKPEDKQRAAVAFSQLRAAMGTLGITAEEQAAVWRILAGIYHLGAAGACKVGRKQFLRFESASRAAEVLGCDVEELSTAVFKHHLRHILAQVTARGQPQAEESQPEPKMTGAECVQGMASGLYEELFAAVVSLINRSFSSQHLSMASIAVVDSPGFQSPRQQRSERAATFEELCHNYVQERLQGLFYEKTFLREMERYREENVEVSFDLPERSPLATLSIIDLSCSQPQVLPGSAGAARRGLLWILDEEVLIPGSGDGTAFERLCSYFATKGPDQEGHLRRCEQTLHFEICHQLGTAPVRYDLTGWVSKAKFNLSAQNAIQVLQNSTVALGRSLGMIQAPGCSSQAFEEELAVLRRKLEKSEQACSELRLTTESLESKIIDLTTELSDERYKGDVTCQALDGERAERLRGTRELQELQSKHDQVQKKLESVEKQLEEAQQLVQLREMKISGSGGEDEWQVRFDCAQTEIVFLRKRLAQLEERLEAELGTRTGLEQKLGEAQAACQAARDGAQRLRRRCQRLACELEDARVLAENQQSRSHELEKRQKKFDLQLAQALGQSAFEKSLREKLSQENTSIRWEMGKLQQSLEHKEAEVARLEQQVAVLAGRVQELSSPGGTDTVPALKKKLWDLEGSAAEQKKELERQTAAVDHLEQAHERLELEIERMKQIHQKELEDKDEELEDTQKSCQKRLRQLEMQLEQEHEQKQMVLHEKQDLEGLIGTLCEQIGHRDFDVEKRLRRDLRRTRALLADVQLLLPAPAQPAGSAQELEHLRRQLEESQAKCAEVQGAQQTAAQELENLHTELETLSRSKTLVDEQLVQLQHERADLLKRIDEDQEDLNELMEKHKALIAQSATDIAQIRELQTQVEDVKKEKQGLQEKLQAAQARVAQLEQCPAERSIVSRQEARIRDLESQLDFQAVQMKRFEVLVLRLRDSIIQMGEELEKAAESEAREKENTRYYQRRMEEMKADMDELVQRELESSRRRMELEQQLAELAEVRQVLQADLGTSIRRIADLQVALEGLRDSDDSDADSVRTARESLCSRRDTDACSSVGSVLSLEPAESIKSWPSSSAGWTSLASASVAGSISAPSLGSRSTQSLRVSRDTKDPSLTPLSSRSAARPGEAADAGKTESPLLRARRREYGKPLAEEEELESPKKAVDRTGETSPSVVRRGGSPAAVQRRPQPPRADGEGSSGRAGAQGSAMSQRDEAEGKEDDVSSIMKKYLGKD